MKKIFTIIAIAATAAVSAQISYGPKIGPALADIRYGEDKGSTPTVSIAAGAFLEYRNPGDLAFVIAADYVTLKTTKAEDFAGIKYGTEHRIGEIQASVAAKYYIFQEVAVFAGGYTGKIVTYKIDGKQQKDLFSGNDTGVLFGVDCHISKEVFLQAKYNVGLKDLQRKQTQQIGLDFDPVVDGQIDNVVKLRYITVGVAYKF